ncbi:hypothetical protein H5410_057611 [Solanum commersonii]|uniref:Uncharacterized protein n=1 Tax=Solanum commersonii TaxID=4109 RepID=A0A9J5WQ81_SOLCO|nr:hypothetical protein H5410_057611 [Solanum commersonii]
MCNLLRYFLQEVIVVLIIPNLSSILSKELASEAVSSSQVELGVSSSQVESGVSHEHLETLHGVVVEKEGQKNEDDDDRKDKNEVDDDKERDEEKNEVDDDEERREEEKCEVEEEEEKKKEVEEEEGKKEEVEEDKGKNKEDEEEEERKMKLRIIVSKLSTHTLFLCIFSLMLLEDFFRNSCFGQYLDLPMKNNARFQISIVNELLKRRFIF